MFGIYVRFLGSKITEYDSVNGLVRGLLGGGELPILGKLHLEKDS